MSLRDASGTVKAALLVFTCATRVGIVGALLLAVVIVAATSANQSESSSKAAVDALAAIAPLYPPDSVLIPAANVLYLYLAIGVLEFAALVVGWQSAQLRDFADWLG